MPTEELTAIVRNERHRFDDTVILEAIPPRESGTVLFDDFLEGIVIKTQAKEGELVPHLSYRFYGSWSTYQGRRGPEKQFIAKTFHPVSPHGQAGVIRYLQLAPKIGPQIAKQLWDKFAGEAVRIVREQPDVAAAATSLSPEHATAAAEYFKGEQALESCTIDMINLLGGRGFPRDTAKKAIGKWGNLAALIIRRNPYILMKFRGCGFARCDQMYLEQGGDPTRMKRQALCTWYALARDSEGDTWKDRDFVTTSLRSQVAGAALNAPGAVKLAKRARVVVTHRDAADKLWIAEGGRGRNEETLARCVTEALKEKDLQWPSAAELEISDHQKEQAGKAMLGMVSLFIGSPGTGKTYTAARILAAVLKLAGPEQIAVAAPTGKAAQRLTEVMNDYGLQLKARTIHSLLGVGGREEGEGWSFDHNEQNPLPYRYLVLDEGSMIDTDLMSAVFRARAVGTHVLIIGDVNQLPPVGHGAPLRDLICAGVPCGELTEIQRNAGLGVRVCHAIRRGEAWKPAPQINLATGDNLVLLETASGEESLERIIKACCSIKAKGHVDPIWDVQVIVAVNEKSPLARKDLNKRLQAELNPAGDSASGNPFRQGDKIVCSKGTFLPLADGAPRPDPTARTNDDGCYYVANGEQARVISVQSKLTVVEFSAPSRRLKIPHGKQESSEGEEEGKASGGVGNFELAYAISCHKSQGSEWPIVIVAIDEYPGARRVCSREWLMTAISRFRKICYLVGKQHVAEAMCRRTALVNRKTFLTEKIEASRKGQA